MSVGESGSKVLGIAAGLKSPSAFVGYRGNANKGDLVFVHNGLHIIIKIHKESQVIVSISIPDVEVRQCTRLASRIVWACPMWSSSRPSLLSWTVRTR